MFKVLLVSVLSLASTTTLADCLRVPEEQHLSHVGPVQLSGIARKICFAVSPAARYGDLYEFIFYRYGTPIGIFITRAPTSRHCTGSCRKFQVVTAIVDGASVMHGGMTFELSIKDRDGTLEAASSEASTQIIKIAR